MFEFYCPSCRKWIWRDAKPRQRVLRERCENAGRLVKMKRRAVGKSAEGVK